MAGDPDVHAFYLKLLEKYGFGMNEEDFDILVALVAKGEPKKAEMDDDIPF